MRWWWVWGRRDEGRGRMPLSNRGDGCCIVGVDPVRGDQGRVQPPVFILCTNFSA